MENQAKTTKCPCGEIIEVPFIDGEYDVCNIRCEKCGRHGTGGNYITGEVTSWLTQKQVNSSEAEYARQSFSADMNEFYGRGNGWW